MTLTHSRSLFMYHSEAPTRTIVNSSIRQLTLSDMSPKREYRLETFHQHENLLMLLASLNAPIKHRGAAYSPNEGWKGFGTLQKYPSIALVLIIMATLARNIMGAVTSRLITSLNLTSSRAKRLLHREYTCARGNFSWLIKVLPFLFTTDETCNYRLSGGRAISCLTQSLPTPLNCNVCSCAINKVVHNHHQLPRI